MSYDMYLSVIIPMYNEALNISSCIKKLCETMERASFAGRYEVIIADDGSTDGCAEIAENVAREMNLTNGEVRVLRSDKNFGKGNAVRRGMLSSRGELFVFTDCDLAYGADVIPAMASRMGEISADVLIGSRAISTGGYDGYTVARRIASRVFVRLLATFAGFGYSDSQCGIKMFRAGAAKTLFSKSEVDGWAFDFEILMLAERFGFSVSEFPVKIVNHGESKVHLIGDSLKMLSEVSKIRKRIGRTD